MSILSRGILCVSGIIRMATLEPDLERVVGPTEQQIVQDYQDVWRSVEARLQVVVTKVQRAARTGLPMSDAWLTQQAQLDKLLQDIQQRIAGVTGAYPVLLEERRRMVVAHGQEDAATAFEHLGLGKPRFPDLAYERLAYQRNVQLLFQNLPEQAANQARRVLLNGVVMGQGPRTVAGKLAKVIEGNQSRALTIARTEMLQSYRGAALDTYRANRDVVQMWNWVAEPDACEICLEAEDASPYQLDVDFDTHPNCRCYTEPVTGGDGG